MPNARPAPVESSLDSSGINPTASKAEPAADDLTHAFGRTCGNCGYLLLGLPTEGNCPECGERYETDELVIPGWAAGSQQGTTTAPPGRVWRIALLSTGWLSSQVILNLIEHRVASAGVYAIADAAILTRLFYRRRMLIRDFGCTSHLRISPRGLAQREGFGPVKLIPWMRDLQITLAPADKDMYVLAASRPGPGSAYRTGKMQWPIAFQFECSSKQALVLCHMLERYDVTVIRK